MCSRFSVFLLDWDWDYVWFVVVGKLLLKMKWIYQNTKVAWFDNSNNHSNNDIDMVKCPSADDCTVNERMAMLERSEPIIIGLYCTAISNSPSGHAGSFIILCIYVSMYTCIGIWICGKISIASIFYNTGRHWLTPTRILWKRITQSDITFHSNGTIEWNPYAFSSHDIFLHFSSLFTFIEPNYQLMNALAMLFSRAYFLLRTEKWTNLTICVCMYSSLLSSSLLFL